MKKIRLLPFIEFLVWFIILALCVFGVRTYRYHKFKEMASYQIFIPDVNGIIVGSPVRYLGVQIGYVQDIKLLKDTAYVRFLINVPDLKLPKGVIVTIEEGGLGGSKHIELYPPDENENTDKTVADLYEMPDVYSEPVSKLTAEVNDPAVSYLYENGFNSAEDMQKIYAIEEENGRANYFWEAAAVGIIEQLYILTKNEDMFLATFTDKDAEDITYRVSILVDLYEDLSDYNLELRKLYNVLLPLEVLNAITVDELRGQLDQIKAQVEQARATLFL